MNVSVVSTKAFVLISAIILIVVILMSAFWLPCTFFANEIPGVTKDSAKEALGVMKDWIIWMASIQTATIAALGLLAKNGLVDLNPRPYQVNLAALVVLLNTLALFFSAWLLTSLPSLMLRVYQSDLPSYDFFNFPLYAYMTGLTTMKYFTVGFFAFWNHWLWGVGILVFGALSVSFVVRINR